MSRARLMMIALGMAFALPVLAGGYGSLDERLPATVVRCDGSEMGADDPGWQWRLRAYRHLDCVTAIVDAVLARDGNRVDEQITIPRRELERIRAHAWWARDAAARIGH